jgi:hypothetical protein
MNHADQVNELSNDEGEHLRGLLSVENADHHLWDHSSAMWIMENDLL